MKKILNIEKISLTYHTKQGEIKALENITFDLDEGEFIAIIGPSGCGKTSILSIIAGLIKPSGGKVYLNGEEIEYTLGTELTEEGSYKAVATDLVENSAEVSFTIDKTAPMIVLNGVKNGGKVKGEVSLSDLSETAEIVVKKNGKLVEYTLGETLKGAGRYEITVTDACGNASRYSFEITKGVSPWAVVGIVAGSLTLLGGVVFIILKKRGVI